jgi:hypothetical protein
MYVLYSISDARSNLTEGTPPFGPTRGIVVAHKGPEASLFTNRYAVAGDGTSVNGAIFPWGAIDKAGTVYVFFNSDKGSPGHFHTYYVWSKDRAATWSKPVKVDGVPMNRGAQIYATGDAGAPGVIDIAWYGHSGLAGADDPTATWSVQFAQVRNATSSRPQITRAAVASKDPIHQGDICLNGLLCVAGGDRSLLDFFELVIGPDGMAQIAYADNHGFGRKKPGVTSQLRGLPGALKGRVVWAKQVGGRSAWDR